MASGARRQDLGGGVSEGPAEGGFPPRTSGCLGAPWRTQGVRTRPQCLALVSAAVASSAASPEVMPRADPELTLCASLWSRGPGLSQGHARSGASAGCGPRTVGGLGVMGRFRLLELGYPSYLYT